MTYRVAVIGAGKMGAVHTRHWASVPNTQVVGVLALTREDTRPLAEAAECPGFAADEFDALLAQTRPDIIDICTPTPLHRHGIEQAAEAGKAIFVEKPLARTLADCDAIIEVVERTGILLMVGHVLRYFPEYAAAKRLVEAGGVGTPAAIRTARMSGMPQSTMPQSTMTTNWYADPEQSGGVALDLLIHDFDWLRWTFGPVTRVYAKGLTADPRHHGKRDYVLATLRLESGAVAHVTGSWAHPGGFRTTLEVAGDGGMIEHDSARSAPLMGASSDSPLAPADDPYFQQLAAFVQALDNGTPPPVTVYEAREAVKIALAVLASLQTGKVVTL